jgi:hypothetical protein
MQIGSGPRFCSDKCRTDWVIERGEKERAKTIARAQTAERKQHKEAKERVKRRSDWLDRLQALVNQYVMHVRDPGSPCCTCGKPRGAAKFDAGHCFSRGSRPELRFELTNIHPQCSVNCNQHGSGMKAEYIEFIRTKYGQAHLDWLQGPHDNLKTQYPSYHDIKGEIARYRQLIRDAGLAPRR